MSGVVLRCPNCGTTKADSGECEACHEAQVRYYCTNHAPGRWLDVPACSQCGARFGEPTRPPAAVPPRPPAAVPPPRAPADTPVRARTPEPAATATAVRRAASRGVWRPGAGVGPWGRRKRPALSEDELEARSRTAAARDVILARFPELLRATSRGRGTPREPLPVPEYDVSSVAPALGGCFRAALVSGMFFVLALVAMFVLLGGSLLQIIGIYF